MTICADVPLAQYTTLGVGGPARWFVDAKDEDEIRAALGFARSREVPFLLLGGGSNLLVSDTGFPGMVVRPTGLNRIELRREAGAGVLVAGAGVIWDSLVLFALQKDLAGIECLAGIPGSVGATPVQNVGAYGQDVSRSITRLWAIDMETTHPVELSNCECGFAYRRSIFNTTQFGRYVITRVEYTLAAGGAPHLQYRDVKQYFADCGNLNPTLAETASAVRQIRASKGMLLVPEDPDSHSAGSFFKNPIVPAETVSKVAATRGCRADEVPQFPSGVEGQVKLSAAWLIELAGFHKGYAVGNVGLSSKHVLAVINRGGATAAEILALRDSIVSAVYAKTGVRLEQEPVLVGF